VFSSTSPLLVEMKAKLGPGRGGFVLISGNTAMPTTWPLSLIPVAVFVLAPETAPKSVHTPLTHLAAWLGPVE
jgi:hypothetical protein